ncbi:hypothetical protein JZO77_23985 [Enterococcus hulanensis]|uniref:hypothetical protein n=1 Tax=Enterococcus hulanensis TaxID=2559929 RepID=UPI001A8FEAC2|nr:hypothetical protein [Enterococcus hulanensis]MBO0459801.1 hypothetical protein [Enterococcus hulanensis]
MIDLKVQLENKFANVIDYYNFELIDWNKDEVSLLNKKGNFVLNIKTHFDNVYAEYIIKNNADNLISYDISNYLSSKCDDEDRKGITNPDNVESRLKAILLIWSKCLSRKFDDMLKGEINWVNDYEEFKLTGIPRMIQEKNKEILKKELTARPNLF